MKIIIINFFGITPDQPGATKHYDMARFFTDKKHSDVEFWISGINHHTDERVSELKGPKASFKTQYEGIDLVYIQSIKHKTSKIRRELGMLVFSIISTFKLMFGKKADVVILSMPPVNSLITLATKLRKINLVADVEDLWPLFLEDLGIKNKAVLKYYDVQATSIYKAAKGIEAVSDGMLNYVKNKVDCNNKVCWMAPLGVDLSIYDNITQTDSLDNYKWKDDFKVMYIGAHGLANDIISVLKVIDIFNKQNIKIKGKKVSFIFIGDGNYKHEMINYMENNNIQNVYFEKAIRSDLVPFYLKQADVCLTNLQKVESFKLVRPNKLFQYMAAKKPIICGIWGEAKRVIEESASGIYIDFTEVDNAVKTMTEFLKRDDLDKLADNGNAYIRKNGSRETIFQNYYMKIEEILNN